MDQLKRDIAEYASIKSDAQRFIKRKNLNMYNLPRRNPKASDLPINAHIGEVYLIKNNNIISYYSYWEQASLYAQVNYIKPMWLCRTDIVNAEHGDPEHLRFLLSGCDVITSIDNAHYSILGFLGAGFSLFIK
jgi:hypothetical protein